MSKALTTTKATALAEADLIKVLGDSLYPGAKADSIKMVLAYCQAAGLDPMMKPVHIVPMSVKKPGTNNYEWRDVVMPGISLYRSAAADSGVYTGKSEPEFGPDITRKIGGVEATFPEWCKITVTRIVAGREAHFTAKEYWLENYATKGKDSDAPNSMWAKRPKAQLAKCTEAQALRMAFPDRLGGQNTAEEMEGKSIDGMVDVTPPTTGAASQGTKTGKPADARSQLDGFSGAAKTSKPAADPEPDPEVEDIDPETGEIIKTPVMPDDAMEAWKRNGKWLAGWKWLSNNLPEAHEVVRQKMVDTYADLLRAVRGFSDSYAASVDKLMEDIGCRIE